MQIKLIFIWMVEHQASFQKEVKGNSEMAWWYHSRVLNSSKCDLSSREILFGCIWMHSHAIILFFSLDVEPMTQGGLAFADKSRAPLPSVQNSTNHEQTSSNPPGSTLASDSQSMYRKSAFHPVTPDVNRSCSFNSSNLAGPSPTVFTKQALMVVGDMFCGPLDSERDLTLGPRQEMDKTEKDFEAAFTGDDTITVGFSKGLAGMGRQRLSQTTHKSRGPFLLSRRNFSGPMWYF